MFILCGNLFLFTFRHRVQNFLGPITLNEFECEREANVTKVQVSSGASTPTILTTNTKGKFRLHIMNGPLTGKMLPSRKGRQPQSEGLSSHYSAKFFLKLRKFCREVGEPKTRLCLSATVLVYILFVFIYFIRIRGYRR